MKRIIKKIIFSISLSTLFLMVSCITDPWEKDVPEFEVCTIYPNDSAAGDFLNNKNFLMWWDILGPVQPKKNNIHEELISGENILTGRKNAPAGARWHHILAKNENTTVPGIVDFSYLFQKHPSGGKPAVFYACISLKSNKEMKELTLAVGSCGLMKIWVNGIVYYAYERGARAIVPDTDKIRGISLKKGFNRIVVKYMDTTSNFRMNRKFCLRFIDSNGKSTHVW